MWKRVLHLVWALKKSILNFNFDYLKISLFMVWHSVYPVKTGNGKLLWIPDSLDGYNTGRAVEGGPFRIIVPAEVATIQHADPPGLHKRLLLVHKRRCE